ncbi:MAG: DUF2975 domain-containing protein [Erythrobacter sp.]
MTDKPNDLLLLAGKILTIISQVALAIGALALLIVAPLVLFFRDKINAEIALDTANAAGPIPMAALLGLFAIGFTMIALTFVFMGKLRAIISSVGDGDPFIPDNAERLNFMAWLMLAVQALMIPTAALAVFLTEWSQELEDAEISIDAGLDIDGILIVVILFILARVFKHGAAMREDLEGTV